MYNLKPASSYFSLKLSFLPHLNENTKLSFMSQIEASKDIYIREIQFYFTKTSYKELLSIPPNFFRALKSAKLSITSINPEAN